MMIVNKSLRIEIQDIYDFFNFNEKYFKYHINNKVDEKKYFKYNIDNKISKTLNLDKKFKIRLFKILESHCKVSNFTYHKSPYTSATYQYGNFNIFLPNFSITFNGILSNFSYHTYSTNAAKDSLKSWKQTVKKEIRENGYSQNLEIHRFIKDIMIKMLNGDIKY